MKLFTRWKKKEVRSLYSGFSEPLFTFGPSVEAKPDSALRLATVYACIDRIASTISTLPVHLFEERNGKNKRVSDHSLIRLLKIAPNAYQTPSDFFAYLLRCLLTRGNAYVYIHRSQRTGAITSLAPLDPDEVTVKIQDGLPVYEVDGEDKEKKKLPYGSVWHIRGLPSSNYLYGVSPIKAAADSIDTGLRAQDLQKAVVDNTASPRHLFETEGDLDAEAAREFLDAWKRQTSGNNLGGSYVLPTGLRHKQLSITLEDKQFIETRKLSIDEICGLFGVPRFMVDGSTPSGSTEEISNYFETYGLRPWLVRIEQSFARDCLLSHEQGRLFIRFSIEGLLRASLANRTNAYKTQLETGQITLNEVRELEDREPFPFDRLAMPLTMAHIDPKDGRVLYTGPQAPIDPNTTTEEVSVEEEPQT